MKVLQINSTCNTGSTGRIAEDIGKKIILNGDESFIAYGLSANPSSSTLLKIGSKADQAFHLLFTRLFDSHGLHSKIASKKLIQKIKKINPDIIHLHNLHGYYINIKILFKFLREFKKPVVWTLHDCWAFTGHCPYFDRVNCQKWQSKCYDCPLKSRYPASYFADRSSKNFLLKKTLFNSIENISIICVSHWLENLVNKSFIKDLSKRTIYSGIDLKRFKPSENNIRKRYSIRNGKFIIGVASEWSDRKGLNDFIELRKILDPEIIIVLVGLSSKKQEILPQNIVGISKTENIDDLAALFSSAEVFVNPSILESFGLVTAEAMACGTPVVVYNATASPELVKPGTGYVVDKGNIHKLKDAIKLILNEDKSLYSDKCRAVAEEYFDQKKQYSKYIELYEDLHQKY